MQSKGWGEIMDNVNSLNGLKDILTILFKHQNKILVTFLTVVGIVTIVSYIMPPVYEANSSLLVKLGRENIYRPEVGEKGSWMAFNPDEVINSEIEVLTSPDLARKVVAAIGVEHFYPKLIEKSSTRDMDILERVAASKFRGDLRTENVEKSNVIQLSFQHENPQIAAEALNLLVDFFKEKHLQVHSDPRSSFLDQTLLTYEQRLKEIEDKLQRFKQEKRVFSLPEQRTLLLGQRTGLDTVLKQTHNETAELQNKINSLANQMDVIPEHVPLSTQTDRYRTFDDAKNSLLNLQLKELELIAKYKEDNPLVVDVRKEIKLVKNFLLQQDEDLKRVVTTGKNVVYQELERQMVTLKSNLAPLHSKQIALQSQIDQIDRKIQELDFNERELEALTRERETTEQIYKTYLEKVEEARISSDMDRRKLSNVSVINAAAVPLGPIKPKRFLYIAFSFIMGLISGLGIAFFSEFSFDRFSSPAQVEKRLSVPVLMALPYDPKKIGRGPNG